jgi:hypothetical protein
MLKYTVEAFAPGAYTYEVYNLESIEAAREEVKNQIVDNKMSGAIIWSEDDAVSDWTLKKIESYSFKDFE